MHFRWFGRTAAALALAGVFGLGMSCTAEVAEERNTDVVFLLGTEQDCAHLLRSVVFVVKSGGVEVFKETTYTFPESPLPKDVPVQLGPSPGAVYEAQARFIFDRADPPNSSIDPPLDPPERIEPRIFSDGTQGHYALIAKCGCFHVECPDDKETCIEPKDPQVEPSCQTYCGNGECEEGCYGCPVDGSDCYGCKLDCAPCPNCNDGCDAPSDTCDNCIKCCDHSDDMCDGLETCDVEIACCKPDDGECGLLENCETEVTCCDHTDGMCDGKETCDEEIKCCVSDDGSCGKLESCETEVACCTNGDGQCDGKETCPNEPACCICGDTMCNAATEACPLCPECCSCVVIDGVCGAGEDACTCPSDCKDDLCSPCECGTSGGNCSCHPDCKNLGNCCANYDMTCVAP